jgi:O-acetyl-ADP-ribose deacetylase (regulator of RNase III)
MPVRYQDGSVFDANTQTIVNTVNTIGVMGRGLALEFKRRFPAMYEDYRLRCARKEVRVGQPYLYRGSTPWILNFPTKEHWRRPSRLEWIRQGLEYFRERYREWGIESIAFPPLGTQLGGLPLEQVYQEMTRVLGPLDIDVVICRYSPQDRPVEQAAPEPAQVETMHVEEAPALDPQRKQLPLPLPPEAGRPQRSRRRARGRAR